MASRVARPSVSLTVLDLQQRTLHCADRFKRPALKQPSDLGRGAGMLSMIKESASRSLMTKP